MLLANGRNDSRSPDILSLCPPPGGDSRQQLLSPAQLTILLAKVEKRVEASGRGRKAFLERRTLFALLGGQTAQLLMFLCPSDYPRFAFP